MIITVKLQGRAGTGKSQIAQHIEEALHEVFDINGTTVENIQEDGVPTEVYTYRGVWGKQT